MSSYFYNYDSISYHKMMEAVANYYGAGSDQWYTMYAWTTHSGEEIASILRQTPGVNVVVNEAGEFVGWEMSAGASTMSAAEASAAAAANAVNSNALTAEAASATLTIPANATTIGGAAGTAEMTSGATAVATGSRVATIAGHVGTWLVGAGVGLKLGVWLDAGLYRAGTYFNWGDMEAYNPENWKDYKIANWLYDYSGYDDFICHFNADNEQLYVDEKVFAMAAKFMYEQGFFDGETVTNSGVPDSYYGDPSTVPNKILVETDPLVLIDTHSPYDEFRELRLVEGSDVKVAFCNCVVNDCFLFVSENPFRYEQFSVQSGGSYGTFVEGAEVTIDGHTFYRASTTWGIDPSLVRQNFPGAHWNDLMTLMYFGEYDEGREGVNKYATTPNLEGLVDLDDILNALKAQYPDLFNQAIKQGTLNDDGTITDHYYVPIGLPSGGTEGEPVTDPDHPGQVDPDNPTMVEQIVKIIQPTPTPTPEPPPDPGTGRGNTPVVVPPTGTASALFKIYNPTAAEITSFGAWLWSSNFVDQLLKIFNDPMQAIISLHKIYATPHIGGRSNIKVGYLDSGVASNWVDEQYMDIDCGSVTLNEQTATILDYAPFVDIRIYLPFVGIVSLDVADVMRGTIGVKYRVDVLTGTLIATVSITRDAGAGGVIYQYTGSCAESFPLSSGSYMGIVTGILGIAAGVAGTIATGGAAAPALLGGAAGLTAMHTKVEHSNGFAGNAGALACKKPYLIISRSQSALSGGIAENVGFPANSLVRLSQCTGYTRVKAVHLSGIDGATDTELKEIETILKSGVII